MVITILVFAFGFLVYHKMDLHQRQLAIAPKASTPPDVVQSNPAAGLIAQEQQAAATDPLVNIADLSDSSPFADADAVIMEPAPENRSVTESFDTLEEPDPTQPLVSAQVDEPAASQFLSNEVPLLEVDEDSTTVGVDPPASLPELAISKNSPTESQGFAATPETPAEADISPTFPESAPAFADIEEKPFAAQSESSAGQLNSSEISFEPAADETSFPGTEQVQEPVLLAMAEPQTSDGSGNGFQQDDSSPDARAPLEEPAESPSLFPGSSEQTVKSAQQTQPADSRGFNAVKNPGGRKAGNTISTAAGSGSDGKFSLAAFNYQNGVSQAAPDDGSTFDSVVVQNGDNYTKISKRVYGTVRYFAALAVFNQHRIPEPKNMRPGMVVLVPAKEVLEERYPEFFVDSQARTQEPAGFLLLEDGTPAYRVGERETISEISERFLGRSSRWIEIYRLNQSLVKDPNKLKAGLILALPADAAEVNVVP